MSASTLSVSDSFRREKPRLWSAGRFVSRGPNRVFDLHPNGTRVALVPFEETSGLDLGSTRVSLVEDIARLGVSREMIGRLNLASSGC